MQQPPQWQQQIQGGAGPPFVRPPAMQPAPLQTQATWHTPQQQLHTNFPSQLLTQSVNVATGGPSLPFSEQLDSGVSGSRQNAELPLYTARPVASSAASQGPLPVRESIPPLPLSQHPPPSSFVQGVRPPPSLRVNGGTLPTPWVPPWASGQEPKSESALQCRQTAPSLQPTGSFGSGEQQWGPQQPESQGQCLPPQRGDFFLQNPSLEFERPHCGGLSVSHPPPSFQVPLQSLQPPQQHSQSIASHEASSHSSVRRPPLQVPYPPPGAPHTPQQQGYATPQQSVGGLPPQDPSLLQRQPQLLASPPSARPPVFAAPHRTELQKRVAPAALSAKANVEAQPSTALGVGRSFLQPSSYKAAPPAPASLDAATPGCLPSLPPDSPSVPTASTAADGPPPGMLRVSGDSSFKGGGVSVSVGAVAVASQAPRVSSPFVNPLCGQRGQLVGAALRVSRPVSEEDLVGFGFPRDGPSSSCTSAQLQPPVQARAETCLSRAAAETPFDSQSASVTAGHQRPAPTETPLGDGGLCSLSTSRQRMSSACPPNPSAFLPLDKGPSVTGGGSAGPSSHFPLAAKPVAFSPFPVCPQRPSLGPHPPRAPACSSTVYASCQAICNAMQDLTSLLLTDQDAPFLVSVLEEIHRLGWRLRGLARDFFGEQSVCQVKILREFVAPPQGPPAQPPPESCELVACTLNALLLHLLAGGFLASPEESLRVWASRTWGQVGEVAEAFFFLAGSGDAELQTQTQKQAASDGSAPTGVATVFRNSCKTLRHISVVGLSHLCADGYRGVRLAALASASRSVGGFDERMATLALQREGFPPASPNPFSLFEQQLTAARVSVSAEVLAAGAASAATSWTFSSSALCPSGPCNNKAFMEGGRAAANASLTEKVLKHRASLLETAGAQLQALSAKSVREGFLLLSLDDASEEVRCAACRLLLALLHSLRSRGCECGRLVVILQSLLWDLMADASLTQQRVVAAACVELSRTAPLRDGALRRAVAPLLFERRVATARLLLKLVGRAAAFNARASKAAVQGVLLLLPNALRQVFLTRASRRAAASVAECLGRVARRHVFSARLEVFRVLSAPAKRALVRSPFLSGLGLREALLQRLAASQPASFEEESFLRVQGMLKDLQQNAAAAGQEAMLDLAKTAVLSKSLQGPSASPKTLLRLQRKRLLELLAFAVADEAAGWAWKASAASALPLDLQLHLPQLSLQFRRLDKLLPSVRLLLAAATAQCGLLTRAEHLRRGRAAGTSRTPQEETATRRVAFPQLPLSARFAAPSRVAEPTPFLAENPLPNKATPPAKASPSPASGGAAQGGGSSDLRELETPFENHCCCARSCGAEECRCLDTCGCADASWLNSSTAWRLLHLEIPCRAAVVLRAVPLAVCLQRTLFPQAALTAASDKREDAEGIPRQDGRFSLFSRHLLQSLQLLRTAAESTARPSLREGEKRSWTPQQQQPSRELNSLPSSASSSGIPALSAALQPPAKRIRVERPAEERRAVTQNLEGGNAAVEGAAGSGGEDNWSAAVSQAARSAASLHEEAALLESLDESASGEAQLLWRPSEMEVCLTWALFSLAGRTFSAPGEAKARCRSESPLRLGFQVSRKRKAGEEAFDAGAEDEDGLEGWPEERMAASRLSPLQRLDCRPPRLRPLLRCIQPQCVSRAEALVESAAALALVEAAENSCEDLPGTRRAAPEGRRGIVGGLGFSSARKAAFERKLGTASARLRDSAVRLSRAFLKPPSADSLLPVELSAACSRLAALSVVPVLQAEHLPLAEGAMLPHWQLFRFLSHRNQQRGLEEVTLRASLPGLPPDLSFEGLNFSAALLHQRRRNAHSLTGDSLSLGDDLEDADVPPAVELGSPDWREKVALQMQLSASSCEAGAFLSSPVAEAGGHGAVVRVAGCAALSLEANLVQNALGEVLPSPAVFACTGGSVVDLNVCVSARADVFSLLGARERALFVCLRVQPSVQLPPPASRAVCTSGGETLAEGEEHFRQSSDCALLKAILLGGHSRGASLALRWAERSSSAQVGLCSLQTLGVLPRCCCADCRLDEGVTLRRLGEQGSVKCAAQGLCDSWKSHPKSGNVDPPRAFLCCRRRRTCVGETQSRVFQKLKNARPPERLSGKRS